MNEDAVIRMEKAESQDFEMGGRLRDLMEENKILKQQLDKSQKQLKDKSDKWNMVAKAMDKRHGRTTLDRLVALLTERDLRRAGEKGQLHGKTIEELRDIHIEDARRVQRLQAQTTTRNAHQDVLLPILMEHQKVISASLLGSQMLDFSNKDAHEVYVIGEYTSAQKN